MIKRYVLYCLRWQLSSPILWTVMSKLGTSMNATIIANLLGGLMFFWIDKFIFTSKVLSPQWEVKEEVSCKQCGRITRGYRLVKTKNYDKTKNVPEFRCEGCSQKKVIELRKRGFMV